MIVKEDENDIILITQNDHAHISGLCASKWKSSHFYGDQKRKSVELAIQEHDRGWIDLDKQPLWDEKTNLPYSFTNYPNEQKLIHYTKGIEEVLEMDEYAGLLCSQHYCRFVSRDQTKEAKKFVQNETIRQEELKKNIINFKEEMFQFHYELLVFCDNLSLYACLNKPGTTKSDEHYFFRKGIPIPSSFSFWNDERLDIYWENKRTIRLSKFPFIEPLTINITQNVLSKSKIAEIGLIETFNAVPTEIVSIILAPEKND